jgi:galactokinase
MLIPLASTKYVYEHHRVKVFRQLVLGPSSEEQRTMLGELMYQSHESYTACGLGSRGTDLIVSLVRAEGPSRGMYGARITGGGSGGTVAVLGRSDAYPAIARIVETYENIMGYRPYVFSASSDGAAKFGWKSLTL